MMAQAQDTITTTRPARRADAGSVRLSKRDIDWLLLAGEHYGEHYGAPYDLLAAALRVPEERVPAIVARGGAAPGTPVQAGWAPARAGAG